MKSIDLFYQGEGFGQIQHLNVDHDTTFVTLTARLAEKHGLPPEALLFIEDEEEPIDSALCLKDRATAKGLKLHVHRCRHVQVTVAFNGQVVEHRFSPSTTVARVKRWAAERQLGMSEEDATEHLLQITGTHDRPSPGTHIGSLTDGRICGVAFDLVADERVNGASQSVV